MGKKILSLIITFAVLLSVLNFTACGTTHFTVTFHANGGTLVRGQEVQVVSSAQEIVAPIYERKGYSLTGFDKVISKINGDTDVYAVWNYNIYKLFFDANGGSVPQTEITVNYDSILQELPKPTRQNYIFAGWMVGETVLHKGVRWQYDSNQVAVAKWEQDGFTIEYDLGGGEVEGLKTFYKSTDEDYILPTPNKKGYDFLGWRVNGGETLYSTLTIESGSSGNLSVKAYYTAKDYELTLDSDGGTISTAKIMVKYGEAVQDLPTPQKDGFKFMGWYVDNEPLFLGQVWNYDQNKTAVAKYEEINPTLYRIDYNLDGGSLVNAKTTYKKTDFDFTLQEPTKEGYKFIGWLKDGETEPKKEFTIIKGSTGDMSFTAVWEKYFVFRFVLNREVFVLGKLAYCTVNGEDSVADIYLVEGETITLPTPVLKNKEDFYFDKDKDSGNMKYWVIDYIENAPVPDNVAKVVYNGDVITSEFLEYVKDGVIIIRPRIRARYI